MQSPGLKKTPDVHRTVMKMGKYSEQLALDTQQRVNVVAEVVEGVKATCYLNTTDLKSFLSYAKRFAAPTRLFRRL